MRGLEPRIHLFFAELLFEMNGRVKPGKDASQSFVLLTDLVNGNEFPIPFRAGGPAHPSG